MRPHVAAPQDSACSTHPAEARKQNPNCHVRENSLQHLRPKVSLSSLAQSGANRMQAIFDRIFGVIDHFFDHEWQLIWLPDDL